MFGAYDSPRLCVIALTRRTRARACWRRAEGRAQCRVTFVTALASLLSGRSVRADVAMTGEVSLTGRVLPIGGVKQKLLAAHRAGLTTVLLPARNAPDLDDVPLAVRDALDVHLVSDAHEALAVALEPTSVNALAA